MPENPIYDFLKKNGLTQKDEASFTKEYSDPNKADQLYSFFKQNNLTTKDSAGFYNTYFKPTGFDSKEVQQQNQPNIPLAQTSDLPTFDINKQVQYLSSLYQKATPKTDYTAQASPGGFIVPEKSIFDEQKNAKADYDNGVQALSGLLGTSKDNLGSFVQDFSKLTPEVQKNIDAPSLIKLQQDNPPQYKSAIAGLNIQGQLFDDIFKNAPNFKEDPKAVWNQASQLFHTKDENYQSALSRLTNIRDIIYKYADNREDALKQLNDYAHTTFDGEIPGTNETLDQDPRSSFLNRSQLLALQKLDITDPAKALSYDALKVQPDKKDADVTLGWEIKSRELEQQGIQQRLNGLSSRMNDAANGGNQDQFNYFKQEYSSTLNDEQRLAVEYPNANAMDASTMAQEIMGQDKGFLTHTAAEMGAQTQNTLRGLSEIPQGLYDFFAGQNQHSRLLQLRALGDDAYQNLSTYKTQDNQTMKTFDINVAPELQQKLDAIKNDNSLTDDEKTSKAKILIYQNPDLIAKTPVEPKLNITARSLLYAGGDVVASLPIFMTTAEIGGAAGLGSKASTFTSVFATGYDQAYKDAIKNNSANPASDALIGTTINALAFAGADKVGEIKKLAGTETVVGKMINKMTPEAIEDALKNPPSAIKKWSESLTSAAKEGLQTSLKLAAASTGANVLNQTIQGQNIDPKQTAKEFVVSLISQAAPMIGLGAIGQTRNYGNIDAVSEAASKPEVYSKMADDMVKDGKLTEPQADVIKSTIDKIAKVYDKVPFVDNEGNTLSDKDKSKLFQIKLAQTDLKEQLKQDLPPKLKENVEQQLNAEKEKENVIYEQPRTNVIEGQDQSNGEGLQPSSKAGADISATGETATAEEKPQEEINILSPLNTNQDAIQIEKTGESVLRNEGIRGESGLQGVEQKDKPQEPAQESEKEKVTRQSQVNDLVDRVKIHNDKAKNYKGRADEVNKLKLTAKDLGLTYDDKRGKLLNANGNRVTKKSLTTNKTATDFDENNYGDKTKQTVEQLKQDPHLITGVDVKGIDGISMSLKQKENSINDIAQGKKTNGAKAVYDALEKMQKNGYVDWIDHDTKERSGVPFDDYFAEPAKELTDAELIDLNSQLGDDAFNEHADEYLNEDNSENARVPHETQHSSTGATEESTPPHGGSGETPESAETQITQRAGASIPLVNEFYKEDVEPSLNKIGGGVKDALRRIALAFNPRKGVSEKALTHIMKTLGERNKSITEIDKAFDNIGKMFDKMKEEDRISFIDKLKRGETQATPELNNIATLIKTLDKNLYDEITKYKPSFTWKENHFRVLWKKIPGSGKERNFSFLSKRPLRGTMGYMKKATLADMSEGIAMGGEPQTTNPVKMFKLAYSDGMKFITAQKMFTALKDDGLVKFVKHGDGVPEGFARLNDRIANVYFKSDAGMVSPGEYYVEENAARILNNYLSRDFIRETEAGRGVLEIKNLYTTIELGLSGFHAVAEGLESISSQIGIGLRKLFNLRDITGFKDIATAPVSPGTTYKLGRTAIKFKTKAGFEASEMGKRFLKKMPEAEQYLDDLFNGGGLLKQNEELKTKTFDAIKEHAGKNNYIGATLRVLPSVNEMILNPLFENFIPALKVGMFLKEFPVALKEQVGRIQQGHTTRGEIARKTVDFIDDRLGEMNFDNLFWNRTFKTSMQLMLRSVTWKMGNIRAMAGAPIEQAMEFYNAARENRSPVLMPKMAWLFGLAVLQVALASTVQKIATGKDLEEFKDLIAPQIDEKNPDERVVLPTYFKDILHFGHSPLGYVTTSMSGPLGKVTDIWSNKDFYNYEIYDPHGKELDKLKDATLYFLPKPFSITSASQMIKESQPASKVAMSFFGLNRAPGYLTHTDIENKIFDLYNIRNTGTKPKAEKEANTKKAEIRRLYREGKGSEAEQMINESLKSGLLRSSQIPSLRKDAKGNESPTLYFFKELPFEDKVYLYKQMTDEEKKIYDPTHHLAAQIKLQEKK